MTKHAELIARLEAASEPDLNGGCWIWSGSSFVSRGRERPLISISGKRWLAHRASFMAHSGKHPESGFVCHKCDVPMCVNPEHLYLGDHKSNMADMVKRKRYFAATQPERCMEAGRKAGLKNTWTAGSGNPRVKLSESEVSDIKASLEKTKLLADRYGVDRTTIQRIRRGALWSALDAQGAV